MEVFWILALLLFNTAISFFNARAVGLVWADRAAMGSFMWLVVWSGAIQAAIGFSMPVIAAAAWIMHGADILGDKQIQSMLSLWYLLVIFPLLSTGMIILIHSWIVAWRERSILNMGTAAYNTFAMGHNLYEASSGIGQALSSVGDLFSGAKDSDNDNPVPLVAIILIFVMVAFSLGLGVLITRAIILHYAGKLPVPGRVAVGAGR